MPFHSGAPANAVLIGGLLKSLFSYTVLYLPQIQLNLFLKKIALLFHVIPMEKESKFLNS